MGVESLRIVPFCQWQPARPSQAQGRATLILSCDKALTFCRVVARQKIVNGVGSGGERTESILVIRIVGTAQWGVALVG